MKKDKSAWEKARNTDRWTEILFRALSSRVAERWKFASFRGARGGEWRGIVDVLAIRKDTSHPNHRTLKSGDLFEMILVQMKGGSAAMPNDVEILRLQTVAKRYGAKAIVLFRWRKNKKRCDFSKLTRGTWISSTAKDIFG